MSVIDTLKQVLAVADSNGVPTGARPISLEVSPHDDEADMHSIIVEYSTGPHLPRHGAALG